MSRSLQKALLLEINNRERLLNFVNDLNACLKLDAP